MYVLEYIDRYKSLPFQYVNRQAKAILRAVVLLTGLRPRAGNVLLKESAGTSTVAPVPMRRQVQLLGSLARNRMSCSVARKVSLALLNRHRRLSWRNSILGSGARFCDVEAKVSPESWGKSRVRVRCDVHNIWRSLTSLRAASCCFPERAVAG